MRRYNVPLTYFEMRMIVDAVIAERAAAEDDYNDARQKGDGDTCFLMNRRIELCDSTQKKLEAIYPKAAADAIADGLIP